MKIENHGNITMMGEYMEVLVDAGCLTNFSPNQAIQLPRLTKMLCKTLHVREVARYLMLNVRIGDTMTLVDKNNGYTYCLRMGRSEVHVLENYENRYRPQPDGQTLVFFNTRLLELFYGQRVEAVVS